MTDEAPLPRRHFQPSTPIATVLVVVFVLVVIGTLHFVKPIPPGGGSTVPTGGTTTTLPPTTTTTQLPKSRVTVQVANGTAVAGLARTYSNTLTTLGWDVLSPINGTIERHTVIYYRPTFGHDAALIAGTVKAHRADIKPMTSASKTYAGDDIVVVLGLNAAR